MDQLYKCGYCGFLLNSQCEDLLQHECLKDRYVEGEHDLVEDHKKVLTLVSKTSTTIPQPFIMQGGAFEESLIRLVQERPLYNLGLPLSERTIAKKYQLWAEIANLLGGHISVEDLQKKWKYLRDSYVRAKKKVNQYKPSGSGAQAPPDPGFKYFEAMKFLDDGASQQTTICSIEPSPIQVNTAAAVISPGVSSRPSSSGTSTPLMSPDPVTPSVKRKKTAEGKKEIEKEILNMMSQPQEKPMDGVDGFLIRLGESLRRLPYREPAKLEIDIMQMVYEAEIRNNIG